MFRGGIGAPEILLILAVVVLLFGAKKLPDLARGSGRALRIFKSETKGLIDNDSSGDSSSDDKDGNKSGETGRDKGGEAADKGAKAHVPDAPRELPTSAASTTEAAKHTSDEPR